MFSAVNQLQKFEPKALAGYLEDGVFAAACAEARLIAITDWTLYPHMTACWGYLLETAGQQSAELQTVLNLDAVVIHSIKYAVATEGGKNASVWGPYCEQPKKSTGAGDRFNAGYALGCVLECALQERLSLATAASGFFVQEARSPSLIELSVFLESLA